MRELKRILSVLLCISLMLPVMPVRAAGYIPEETLKALERGELAGESKYQEEEPSQLSDWDGLPAIYWNPGGESTIASMSVATKAGAGSFEGNEGSDHADGLTPFQPVKNLNTAIRKAKALSERMGIELSDVTVYAMNPMVIPRGLAYMVRGNDVTLSAWEGREDGSDQIFIVDGGQLTLNKIILQPMDGGRTPEEAKLIYVNEGKVQLGENTGIHGTIVLDYYGIEQGGDLATASEANAGRSNKDQYVAPVIELLKKFDGASDYWLDLQADSMMDNITLVKALYSDEGSSEDFKELFQLVDQTADWDLAVEERIKGVLRDTQEDELEYASAASANLESAVSRMAKHQDDRELTEKSLVAIRPLNQAAMIFWNPGGEFIAGETVCRAGRDTGYDGLTPGFPVRSLAVAMSLANGGPVICMQTVDLSNDATEFLGPADENGYYIIDGGEREQIIESWSVTKLPILRIPDNTKVIIEDIYLRGADQQGSHPIYCDGGQLILKKNVRTLNSYIHVELRQDNQAMNHPIQVLSDDIYLDLFFGGINQEAAWNYQDVVVAKGDLLALGTENAGGVLLANINLDIGNRQQGGTAKYSWELIMDISEDPLKDPVVLQLYTEFYYDAIFLDGVNGSDQNFGGSCNYPVKTFVKARELLIRGIIEGVQKKKENPDAIVSIPTAIYLCGTVTVNSDENWYIPELHDEHEEVIPVEIRTHTEPVARGGILRHPVPDTLIHVTGAAATLRLGDGILIRSTAGRDTSNTIMVDQGATLILEQNATLTGLRNPEQITTRSKGTHIIVGKSPDHVINRGRVELAVGWNGTIDSLSTGIKVYGSGSWLEMNGGKIYNHQNETAESCAGVLVSEGASFEMNGGIISDNTGYQKGVGVLLNENSSFYFKRGIIEKNDVLIDNSECAEGVGVYVSPGAFFEMGEAGQDHQETQIRDHRIKTRFSGIGIHIAEYGMFRMYSGVIANNWGSGLNKIGNLNSYGLGIANLGSLQIFGGEIKDNRSYQPGGSNSYANCLGAGLYLAGNPQIIMDAVIAGNYTGSFSSSISTYTAGGGIYIATDAAIIRTTIENNRSYNGAGCYVGVGQKLTISESVIQNNSGTREMTDPVANIVGYGGGIYNDGIVTAEELKLIGNKAIFGGGIYTTTKGNSTWMKKCTISLNDASYGGGIRSHHPLYLNECTIDSNHASIDGGGIHHPGSIIYAVDVKIKNNRADGKGGGISISSSYRAYITERSTGYTEISGNEAQQGGGICVNRGTLYLNFTTPGENTVVGEAAKGNNIYLEAQAASAIYFTKGTFNQPANTQANVYNVDMTSTGTNSGVLHMDMTTVALTGDRPVYLNTTNNYLSYLKNPTTDTYKSFPIDLNTEVFDIGSTVIKPAANPVVEFIVPNETNDNTQSLKIYYPLLYEVKTNLSYSDGGVMPERSHLGPFKDPKYEASSKVRINAVVVGDGVYLSGKGDDYNLGTSPEDAVATFDRAAALLEIYTENANANSDPGAKGFVPVIYVCGNVVVDQSDSWAINYDHQRYTTESKYVAYEEASGNTPEKAQIKRFSSFVNSPLFTIRGSNTELTINKLLIDGMANAVVTIEQSTNSPIFSVEAGTKLFLKDDAWIRNNFANTIDVYGYLELDGAQSAPNHQIEVNRGTAASINHGGVMVMKNYARIIFPHQITTLNKLTNYTNALYCARGVDVRAGGTFTMAGHTKIAYLREDEEIEESELTAERSNIIGVVVGASNAITSTAKFTMTDSASLEYLYAGIAVNAYKAEILLTGQSLLDHNHYGVYAYALAIGDINITMDGDASIQNSSSRGMEFYQQTSYKDGNNTVTINMKQNSRIADNTKYGISLDYSYTTYQINMEGNSSITGHSSAGIYESDQGITKLVLSMAGNSRIGSNALNTQENGIYLNSDTQVRTNHIQGDRTAAYQIYMSDSAMIGGDYLSDQPQERRGNTLAGIRSEKPLMLTMDGNSKITYNGNGDPDAAGLYLSGGDPSAKTVVDYGESTILIQGQAAIDHNKGKGIYTVESNVRDNDKLQNYNIVFTGNSSMQNNFNESIFVDLVGLFLKENAVIGAGQSTISNHNAIDSSGYIFLDGTVTITGNICLKDHNKPIILTADIPDQDPVNKYHLRLIEGFVGQRVVVPDWVSISDVSAALKYFVKESGEGMAAVKDLAALAPDIILAGENNIYLSGRGDDTANGTTPSTSVRTFKRAKELLETGYYTAGANIIICNIPGTAGHVPMEVRAGDESWEFEADGYFTNPLSGDRWQPKITRHEEYFETMIQINADGSDPDDPGAETVTFKNIIIDGKGEDDTISAGSLSAAALIKVIKGSAVLSEGAVLTNNRRVNSNVLGTGENVALGVYVGADGKLILDGGRITNLILEDLTSEENFSTGIAVYNNGWVTMKKGSIDHNKIEFKSGQSDLDFTAAMVVNSALAVFEMSGGSIDSNEISSPNPLQLTKMKGGALAFLQDSGGSLQGGVISQNIGGKGAGIYYSATQPLELGAIYVRQNKAMNNQNSLREFCPVYVSGDHFQLRGGTSVLEDPIYLDSTRHIISMTGNIYQNTKKYHVYIKIGNDADQFKKGSVVVQPDLNHLMDASSFVNNFVIHENPYILDRGQSDTKEGGTIDGVKEKQCLILMKAVFLDSQYGSDTNDGLTPDTAAATFNYAKMVGEQPYPTAPEKDYYIIYICGPVYHQDGERWEMEDVSYMCRYTGFEVFGTDGITSARRYPYNNHLIESNGTLTLQNIRILGRRDVDDFSKNGESIVKIQEAHKVILNEGTVLRRNNNTGSYLCQEPGHPDYGLYVPLRGTGGAVMIEPAGTLEVNGGAIQDVTAVFGSAIYVDADTSAEGTDRGVLRLHNQPEIVGDIYLNGHQNGSSADVNVTEQYVPFDGGQLYIRVANDYSGRIIVQYPSGAEPTLAQIEYYKLEDKIDTIYDFVKAGGNRNQLILQLKNLIYVDGINGDDNHSGQTPDDALRTLRGVYQAVFDDQDEDGALVMVVNPLTIKSGETINLQNMLYKNNQTKVYRGKYTDGSGSININCQLFFKRYAKPRSTTHQGYTADTNIKELFCIESNGHLKLNGIFLDGHSEASISYMDYLTADGVVAEGPLIRVEPGGNLTAGHIYEAVPDDLGPGFITFATTTKLLNNYNNQRKSNVIGKNQQNIDLVEGSSAGIEVLADFNSGTAAAAFLEAVEFSNMKLGNGVIGGTDLYLGGELTVQKKTLFTGSVYLEGLGSPQRKDLSRHIKAGEYGTPFANSFQVLIRDPYDARDVVEYPSSDPAGPDDVDAGYFLLEEQVNRHYSLKKRTGQKYIFELTLPKAIYVDGKDGADNNGGYYPTFAVRTLGEAYKRLKSAGGKVIYIVNTVEVNEDTLLEGAQFADRNLTVDLNGITRRVDLRRYIRPQIGEVGMAGFNPLYNKEDHTGVLIEVKNNAILTLQNGLFLDGHHDAKNDPFYNNEEFVDRTAAVKAPMVLVETGGTLMVSENAYLFDNHNTKELVTGEIRLDGGAIHNNGTVQLSGGVIESNEASKGDGIYQNGIFELNRNPDGIAGQEIYLTSVNDGTPQQPVWNDRIIAANMLLTDPAILDLEMDHAVAGRAVIDYRDLAPVDHQYRYYRLGTTVPQNLFLVERSTQSSILELQDYKVLDITVPKETFLVIYEEGTNEVKVVDGASNGTVFKSPEFSIKNNGRYPSKVFLQSFINQNTAAGITDHDPMNLVASAAAATDGNAGEKDLYLAIKGANPQDPFGAFAETSLHDFGTEGGTDSALIGELQPGETGKLVFTAAASKQFINHYMDSGFPLTGMFATAQERMKHMRTIDEQTEATAANHARAKYKLVYRVEILPDRR